MYKTSTNNEVTTVAIINLVPFHFHSLIGIIGNSTPIKPPNAQIPSHRVLKKMGQGVPVGCWAI